jgi:hypothetical protein
MFIHYLEAQARHLLLAIEAAAIEEANTIVVSLLLQAYTQSSGAFRKYGLAQHTVAGITL